MLQEITAFLKLPRSLPKNVETIALGDGGGGLTSFVADLEEPGADVGPLPSLPPSGCLFC
jgi:hypothetical protein